MDIKVSQKYQILIPREVRKALDIKKGGKFQMLVKGRTITLVPKRPLKELRGFLKGMKGDDIREGG